jgi:protein SHQ1
MITPLFKVDQDEKYLNIKIKVKYVKFSEVDFFIEGNNFRFYLKPYYLNLYFSDNLKAESENNNSKYDIDKELIDCRIEKEIEGCQFKNLELISTMLNENKSEKNQIDLNLNKKIEEIVKENNNDNINSNTDTNNLSQQLSNEILSNSELFNEFLLDSFFNDFTQNFEKISLSISKENMNKFGYGFNMEFIDVFNNREEERLELLDLNPNNIDVKHRYFAKMEKEMEDFVPERYVYDELLLDKEDEGFSKMVNKKLKLKENLSHNDKGNNSLICPKWENEFNFSEKEINVLKSINKTKLSLLDSNYNIHFNFYLQTIDILFAILYDYRTTEFEHNSESGWTINKLSSVFSCCVDFNKNFFSFSEEPPLNFLEEAVKNVLVSCYRRVLCYPLYRNLKICKKIKEDLSEILSKGIFQILKFFLKVRIIFERTEPRHILNKIYVDSFIQWLQFYSIEKIWNLLGKYIKSIEIEKSDIRLNLEDYEKDFELENNEMEMN